MYVALLKKNRIQKCQAVPTANLCPTTYIQKITTSETKQRHTLPSHKFHETRFQASRQVTADSSDFFLSAIELLHLRKQRNDVLIVQGFKVHILIYCLDTELQVKCKYLDQMKMCAQAVENFFQTNPAHAQMSPLHWLPATLHY